MRTFRGVDDVQADIAEILMEQEQQDLEPKWTFKELLSSKALRLPLVLVACLASAQQLSGINVVSFVICITVLSVTSASPLISAPPTSPHSEFIYLATSSETV